MKPNQWRLIKFYKIAGKEIAVLQRPRYANRKCILHSSIRDKKTFDKRFTVISVRYEIATSGKSSHVYLYHALYNRLL